MAKRNIPAQYNRQTSQYRKNIARGDMKKAGVKPPKFRNNPLLKKLVLAFAIVWVVASVTILFIDIRYALLVLLVGVLGAAGVVIYVNHADKKIIRAYIKMGLSKDDFKDALEKRKTDPRQIKRIENLWDKVEQKERAKQ